MDNEQETWKPIPGFENYGGSTLGRIKRLVDSKTIKKFVAGTLLNPSTHPKGYLITCLYNGKTKTMSVHRWIALTFIPNPNNLPQVDHINEIKTDNRVCNLRWVTNEYNTRRSQSKPLKGKNLKTEEEKIFLNSRDAAKYINGDTRKIQMVYDGKRPHHRNWHFEKLNIDPKDLIDNL
jgi:hypothetical protein